MSMFFSGRLSVPIPRPVSSFQYRESGAPPLPHVRAEQQPAAPHAPEVNMSEQALAELLARTRMEARQEIEFAFRSEADARAAKEQTLVAAALESFLLETRTYYARVESEVVRLALSIAAKILHREAQVDPMLVAALVQVALNQLRENTEVTVRVRPEAAGLWRDHFARRPQPARINVAEDPELESGGCVLETELGIANFSLAAQLKEVEQGFFDLLAQTPRS